MRVFRACTALRHLAAAAFTLCAAVAAVPAAAQAFPGKAITMVVGYQPGGPTDILARLLAVPLSQKFGQPVVVENRPGAESRIAAQYVARAPADGHTIMLGSSAVVAWPVFTKSPGIDAVKELTPIGKLTEGPLILVANASTPFNTLPEMIAYAKANPGKLNFATTGIGDPLIYMEQIKQRAGIQMENVAYKGAEQYNALLRGDVQLAMNAPGSVAAMEKEGRLKFIAVTGARRLPAYPSVPTFQELGYEGFTNFWYALYAPAGTPSAAVRQLNEAALEGLKDARVVEGMKKMGIWAAGSTPEQLSALYQAQLTRYAEVARAAKIEPQ